MPTRERERRCWWCVWSEEAYVKGHGLEQRKTLLLDAGRKCCDVRGESRGRTEQEEVPLRWTWLLDFVTSERGSTGVRVSSPTLGLRLLTEEDARGPRENLPNGQPARQCSRCAYRPRLG